MSVITKLIGIWAAGKTVSSTSLLIHKLLNGLAMVIVFTILSSILFAALILGGLFIVYQSLLMHGFDTMPALFIVGGIILAAFFVLLGVTVHFWQKLHDLPQEVTSQPSPTDHISGMAEAFLDGLMHPDERNQRTRH